LILASPLALAGVVLYILPYQLPRLATRFSRGTPDVFSTYKLGAGLLVYPIVATAYIVVAAFWLPLPLALVAAAIVLASPFAALAWTDRSSRLFGSLRLLVPSDRIRELSARRTELMARLEDARTRLLP
jgi:hypothetical protein